MATGRHSLGHPAPLGRAGRGARLAPFVLPVAVAFATIPLPPNHSWAATGVASATTMILLIALAVVALPWDRLPDWAQAGPPLAFILVVAVLRAAEGGGASGFSALFLLPVLWLALYGTRGELAAAVALVAAAMAVPNLVLGAPDYPVTEWRRALLFVVVALVAAFTVQRLVREVRQRATLQDVVARVASELSEVGDPRPEVCRAAAEIAGADAAVLFEPEEKGKLVSTALSGLDVPPLSVRAGEEPSGAMVAFTSERPFFVAEAGEHPALSPRLVEMTGARSCYFQPVRRRHQPIGVLAVIWRDPITRIATRATEGVRLVASEAAVAIDRANLLARLDGLAHTDELTGLPNRRAWNEELPRALARAGRGDGQITIAMLDLDRFKAFNDAHGHQRGDRLLKETAAAWREQLREGDLLARYGGEEFAVILHDCSTDAGLEIVERMRAATPEGLTCSAGTASSEGAEDAERLVARADGALYRAKAAGRDQTVSAG